MNVDLISQQNTRPVRDMSASVLFRTERSAYVRTVLHTSYTASTVTTIIKTCLSMQCANAVILYWYSSRTKEKAGRAVGSESCTLSSSPSNLSRKIETHFNIIVFFFN